MHICSRHLLKILWRKGLLAHDQQFLLLPKCFQFYALIKLWLSFCQCDLLQVWCIFESVKFSPLPDVNYLMSVTYLHTLLEWCNCSKMIISKMNNIFLSNNSITLNTYLLCWFCICKTWNIIRLFVNKYKCQQLIMYTCIWNNSFDKMDSEGSDQTLKMCSFSIRVIIVDQDPFLNCYCSNIKAFEKGTGSKMFSLEAWIKMW